MLTKRDKLLFEDEHDVRDHALLKWLADDTGSKIHTYGLREGGHAAGFSRAVPIARREHISRGGCGSLFFRTTALLHMAVKTAALLAKLACSGAKEWFCTSI